MSIRRGWLFAGIGLLTCGTLVLELALTRIFSVIMHHHFTFLAISLALFGFGAAGVVVYLRPAMTGPERAAELMQRYALYAAGAVCVAVIVVLRQTVGPGAAAQNLVTISLIYLVAALPFFFAGLVLTLAVDQMKRDIGRLYFADLLGAAIGCLLVVPLFRWLGGPSATLFSGVLFAAAQGVLAVAVRPDSRTRLRIALGFGVAFTVLIVAVANTWAGFLRPPSVKGTHEDKVVFAEWNSFSRITVEDFNQHAKWLKIDSSAATRVFSGAGAADDWKISQHSSESRVASLVYALKRGGRALIIGPGGGADVVSALHFGVRDITGVEINPIIVNDVMLGAFREYTGGLYERPELHLVTNDGRNFVRGSSEQFDSIQATLVDTWAAASSGAFSLSENNLYTHEAFVEYLEHLTPNGVLTMTRWLSHPPREFLRLLVLGRSALDELGVDAPSAHFYVAADHRMATFLLKRSPFTAEEIATLDARIAEAGLRRLYSSSSAEQNHYAEFLRAEDWRAVVAAAPFDISPPDDNRPFFFHTLRPVGLLDALLHPTVASRHNLGVTLLLYVLVAVLVLVAAFLVVPLFAFRRDVLVGQTGIKARYLAYFVAIGIGFIALEITLLQELVLFLGHPTWVLVAVMFALLATSGLGSFLVRHATGEVAHKLVRRNGVILLAVVVFYLIVWPPLFAAAAGLPLAVRILVTVALVTPLGLLMGTFLPLGISAAGDRLSELVPWAWGLNGGASVLGSVLAVALAMNIGYSGTAIVALSCYALAVAALGMRPVDG